MTILVIGNGFDLAHHLPTQYSDFLNFVKAFKAHDDSDYSQFLIETEESNVSLYTASMQRESAARMQSFLDSL